MSKIETAINKIFTHSTKNFIFVYTPPKVGSTTLVTSLRISLGRSYNVIHIHDDIMLNVLTGINDVTVNEILKYMAGQGKNVYVIDVYRSPIERKMSEYFEKISPYHFNNTEDNICEYNMNRITDRFNKLFPHLGLCDHYLDKYDIITPIPFNFDKKYTLQIENGIKYIKLRLCDSAQWDKMLTEILKTNIIIINDYQTESKKIAELYNKFKQEYKLPLNYYELIKDCKYFNYYYSSEEQRKYLNNWESRLTTSNFSPYTDEEYNFYVVLYLENQYINDIQIDHYIDNGCFCELCNKKRRDLYFKATKGEKITEKIIHIETVNNHIENRNKKMVEIIKAKISQIKKKNKNEKSFAKINI